MPNRPITIEGIDQNGLLILSDKGKTNVDPGDTVTWKIHPGSGVAEIKSIVKSDGVNVFSKGPSQVGSSNNWKGTVNPEIPKGSEEKYDIHFTRKGSTQIEIHDPKIIVNPWLLNSGMIKNSILPCIWKAIGLQMNI